MKVAKLPNGKTLKFPDETSEEAIDDAVKVHMKDHIEHHQKQAQKEEISNRESNQKHQELLHGLNIVAQLLHHISEQNVKGHATVLGALNEHTNLLQHHASLLSKPKRMKAVRDNQGKITGSEEY